MVNKERIQLLVNDLMRDDIHQGNGTLRSVENGVTKDCCLARACEVFREHSGIESMWVPCYDATGLPSGTFEFKVIGTPEGQPRRLSMYDTTSGTKMPGLVSEWFGLSQNPYIRAEDEDEPMMSAIAANDDHKWSFKKIAEAFKQHYIVEGRPY